MDDASLDEFLGDDDADPSDATATDVDPAVSTYTWSSEPAECAACGTATNRRWRDGEQFVCGDCKEW